MYKHPSRVDTSALVLSLSSHRHSYIGLVWNSLFIVFEIGVVKAPDIGDGIGMSLEGGLQSETDFTTQDLVSDSRASTERKGTVIPHGNLVLTGTDSGVTGGYGNTYNFYRGSETIATVVTTVVVTPDQELQTHHDWTNIEMVSTTTDYMELGDRDTNQDKIRN